MLDGGITIKYIGYHIIGQFTLSKNMTLDILILLGGNNVTLAATCRT